MRLEILAMTVALAACAAPTDEAASALAVPDEGGLCRAPGGVQCRPTDSAVICQAACSPYLGQCPDYDVLERAECDTYCPVTSCDAWCRPNRWHKCVYGAPALTGDP